MRRKRTRAAVLSAFRQHGRLTDAVLAWLVGHVGIGPGAAKAARYQLARRGDVRFEGWQLRGQERPVKVWEFVRRISQP